MVNASPLVLLPRINGPFEVTRLLGVGTTCEVFEGRHLTLDVPIAVKVLLRELAENAHFRERMRVEAHLTTRLASRHIVHCFDRGTTETGLPYTVFERLNGDTLAKLLERLRVMDEFTTIHLGGELLEALAAVHAIGAVHRDVNLRNLILHQPEHEACVLKLLDFGYALIRGNAPKGAPEPSSIKTDPDTVVGTPRFASPEAALGEPLDGRSDIYAAGVVLYSLLTGRDPFAELRTPAEVLEAHVHEPAPRLSRFARDVPKPLEAIVMRMLEKDPRDRFQSARDAGDVLQACGEELREGLRRVLVPVPSDTPTAKNVVDLDLLRQTARPVLRPGERCGPYIIDGLVDGGGFSEVYEAHPAEGALTRPVALKVLKKVFAADPKMRSRFQTEVTLLSKIRHPNVVRVYDAGEHEGMCWMAMELIPGQNLHRQLRRQGKVELTQAMHWAYGVASALSALHRLGILHRDLKPDNIIIDHMGDVCVVDAGLAKLVSDAQMRTSRHIMGTVAYMSPEALVGLPQDARSDLYAWGLIVFEMLVGRHPFSEPTPPHRLPPLWQMTLHHLNDALPAKDSVAADVPESLWNLILRTTDKLPERRPQNADEVLEALEAIADELEEREGREVNPSARLRVRGTPRSPRPPRATAEKTFEKTPKGNARLQGRVGFMALGIALGALITAITFWLTRVPTTPVAQSVQAAEADRALPAARDLRATGAPLPESRVPEFGPAGARAEEPKVEAPTADMPKLPPPPSTTPKATVKPRAPRPGASASPPRRKLFY